MDFQISKFDIDILSLGRGSVGLPMAPRHIDFKFPL